jgi:hypothetical protein
LSVKKFSTKGEIFLYNVSIFPIDVARNIKIAHILILLGFWKTMRSFYKKLTPEF